MSGGSDNIRPGADLRTYYRFQSKIYDATRWSFLFGRGGLIDRLARLPGQPPRRILEIGCGTGKNILALRGRFPHAHITGLDLSGHMLDIARKKLCRGGAVMTGPAAKAAEDAETKTTSAADGTDAAGAVRLVCQAYDGPLEPRSFGLVVMSYTLTMINPGFESVIAAAAEDLADSGRIAVVDFHDSPVWLFRKWMAINHVRMDGQLDPVLGERFAPQHRRISRAYAGLWRWITFIGSPRRS